MSIISKELFVSIIDELKEVNDFVSETNVKARKLNDYLISDFFDADSIVIHHDSLVVLLLQKIFDDEGTIDWWIFEKDFGRSFQMGDILEEIENGDFEDIDLGSVEKLYDYLVRNWKKVNKINNMCGEKE